MAFNVENGSGSALDIDDLGITLETGEITDLSLRGDVQNIINSAQAGEEISNLISAGDLIVKDPLDGVTDLSIANGLVCARSYADPNYRVGAGARIGDISDVTLTTPANTQVLTYDNGVWINSAGGGSTQDLYETFAGDTGTPTTASSPTDTLTITGGTNIATVASADTITVNGANIWNTMAGDSGSTTPNIALDTFTIAGGTGITTAVAGDTLTITNDAPNIVQNLWETITADSGSAVANIATDTLTIAGGAGISTSITGDVLTISTGVGDVPAVLARRTTPMPITSSFVTITFDTTDLENDDTVVDHNNVTNTSRITVKETGLYEIYFQTSGLVFTASGAGFYTVETRLIKNGVLVAVPGADILSSGYTGGAATTTEVNAPNTNIILELVANDYLEVQIRYIVLNGVTGTVANATSDSTFWVAKLAGAKGDAGTDGAPGPPGSGSTINVYEEGVLVPNSPFSELNFIGEAVTATDAGSGRTDITIIAPPTLFDRQAVRTITAFNTTSATAVDITSSTLTTKNLGAVGDYIITFSCEYVIGKLDRPGLFSLNVGGSIVMTQRASGNDDKKEDFMNFSFTHLAKNVASGTIIKAQVAATGGENVQVDERELVIDGVLSANVLP